MDWIQWLVTLITAFGGAYFGAWLNKNRYYQEKWWDRKLEAYSQIIEDLYTSYLYAATYYEDHTDKPNTSIDWQDLSDKRKFAAKNLAKSVQLGDFIISDKASELLRNFHQNQPDLKSSDDFVEFAWNEAQMTHECLKEITRLAKEDLEVARPKFYERLRPSRFSESQS